MSRRIFFVIAISVLFIFLWGNSQISGNGDGQNKLFKIEKGQGVNQISSQLEEEAIIKNGFMFKLCVWIKKKEAKLQAGEYVLNSGMDIMEILEILTDGKVLSQEREIKIIEGWNSREIGAYLDKEKILHSEDFLKVVNNNEEFKKKWEFDFLNDIPASKSLEGFLFPDTYRIYKNSEAEDIVAKMLSNFDQKLNSEMRESIKQSSKSIYEILTMSSIIQKEVSEIGDMKIVSDIFWRRIKSNIALQSCATIAYILGVNKKQYSYEDTRIDSPYNTYLHLGLPPWPICNPGIDAIEAAIYPQSNKYWFFLSKENGETVFSKSLDEHNLNKAKYL
ncbi:endolytic transglycosylase MltG [Patescibacteria group bacterium]